VHVISAGVGVFARVAERTDSSRFRHSDRSGHHPVPLARPILPGGDVIEGVPDAGQRFGEPCVPFCGEMDECLGGCHGSVVPGP
jgi:hypothetical protein